MDRIKRVQAKVGANGLQAILAYYRLLQVVLKFSKGKGQSKVGGDLDWFGTDFEDEDDPPWPEATARQEIAVAFRRLSAKFSALSDEFGGENGFNSCTRVRAGGHNNTEINPVFRGMSRGESPAILTKGKL